MRLQCNGSSISAFIRWLAAYNGFQETIHDKDMGYLRSASRFATGTHKCDYRLECKSVNISNL